MSASSASYLPCGAGAGARWEAGDGAGVVRCPVVVEGAVLLEAVSRFPLKLQKRTPTTSISATTIPRMALVLMPSASAARRFRLLESYVINTLLLVALRHQRVAPDSVPIALCCRLLLDQSAA